MLAVASLVQTIDTSQFSPPSPDPAGIVFLPGSDTLLIADSEVNEMSIFTGDNLFEITRTGNLVNTSTTTSFSDEPTGVTLNPLNGHLFFSDDTGSRKIYELDPASDGLYGTADDIITSFRTAPFGSSDPEGVAYDFLQGRLFVADGAGDRIYEISPGSNGVFDGIEPDGDDQVSSFDVLGLGLSDPEGIAFNGDNGHLYVVGNPGETLFEITTTGALVQLIDISAANANKPSGVTFAPSSSDPAVINFYITARGVDNGKDPNENDGRIYEMSFEPGPPGPVSICSVSTHDAYINQDHPDENKGDNNDLKVKPDSGKNLHSLVEFDLSVIPLNSNVTEATLMLYEDNKKDDQTIFVHRILADWEESQVTWDERNSSTAWNTSGGDFDTNVIASFAPDIDKQYREIDVTNVTQDWVNGTSANHGLLLRSTGANGDVKFKSREEGNSDKRPLLCVSYDVTPENEAPTVDAGQDQTLFLDSFPTDVNLDATASDDGLPDPPGELTTLWSQVSGPAVSFADATAIDTTVTVSGAGTYVLRLTADDGELASSSDITLVVQQILENPIVISESGGSTDVTEGGVADTYSVVLAAQPAADVSVSLASDGQSVVSAEVPGVETILAADFDTNEDGFAYVDDTFRGTASPTYATGVHVPSGGFNGGGLQVTLGGVDSASVLGMSGGWQRNFTLNEPTALTFSFNYNLTQAANYEADEFSQALVSIDGVLYGDGSNDYIAQLVGDGNGGSPQSTGWQTFEFNVGTLSAGNHTIALGAYNNKKTFNDETTTLLIDDVAVFAESSSVLTFTPANWNVAQTVTVTAVDDLVVEGQHTSTIMHSASSQDPNFNGATIENVVASITDNDSSTLTIPVLYFAYNTATTFPGNLSVDNEDIISFDGTSFGMVLDGSDLGLSAAAIDAFKFIDADEILLSFSSSVSVPGIAGTVDDSDIVKFTATELGDTTAGTFEMYFDASDVELSTSSEDVDAIDLLDDGRLLISTTGDFNTVQLSGQGEDIIAFTPTSLGDSTAGTLSLYFDGTDVGLGGAGVDGVSVNDDGDLYLTTASTFTVPGLSGKDEDVFLFHPTSLGENTAGTYESELFFDGNMHAAGGDLKAIDVVLVPLKTPPPIDFRVMADVPYSPEDVAPLVADLANVASDDEFFVHLGDITPDSSSCDESVYSDMATNLQTSSIPVFLVPGDNEWSECSDPNQAWTYWDTYLMRLEESWPHEFSVLRQSVREENFAFVDSGVLFVGINLVGGAVHDANEWSQRMTDDADWVSENFSNFGNEVTSAVVFGHAYPDPTGGDRQQFGQDFVTLAQDLGKPILYIMGDEHSWTLDHPFNGAPNVTRVVVNGGVPSVRVTVTHNPGNPFVFDQSPLVVDSDAIPKPGGTQLEEDQLTSIVDEAISMISHANDAELADVLATLDFQVVDLPGNLLGRTLGSTIQIDTDAAQFGWFVDATPNDDTEFTFDAANHQLLADSHSAANQRVDLLTVVMHEFGHILGFEHTDSNGLMDGALPLGTRRLPEGLFGNGESRSWQNIRLAGDVNNDGSVTAVDALRIINELGRREYSEQASNYLFDPDSVDTWPDLYFDQNGDDRVTAIDALRVLNELARQEKSEGERVAASSSTSGDREPSVLQHQVVRLMQATKRASTIELQSNSIAVDASSKTNIGLQNAEDLEAQETLQTVDQMLSDDSFFAWLADGSKH